MMRWSDEAIVLGGRKFGEGGLVLDVLTAGQGRRAGLVHGGASRARRAQYEPGNTVRLGWSARLEEHLGRFDVAELVTARAAGLFHAPAALAAVQTITTLLRDAITEGDRAGSVLYPPTAVLLDALDAVEVWPALYVRWELGLLAALGFGLDLTSCAVTGVREGLSHVSPRSGRAVSREAAGPYLDRLLPLPAFLAGSAGPPTPQELADGFALTGGFIERRIYAGAGGDFQRLRTRMVERLAREMG